jgi:hypothetical protein
MFMASIVATKKQTYWHKLVLFIGKCIDNKKKKALPCKGKGKAAHAFAMAAYGGVKLELHSCLTLLGSITPWLAYLRGNTPSSNCKGGCVGPSGWSGEEVNPLILQGKEQRSQNLPSLIDSTDHSIVIFRSASVKPACYRYVSVWNLSRPL